MTRQRYAVVGTGSRAETFIRSLVLEHADRADLVAFADTNPGRMHVHNRWLADLGHAPVPTYRADDVPAMLDKERVNTLIVTSVDATHESYIVAALQAGRSVVTEKPMTTTADSCERILLAARRARERGTGTVSVAFNYRYNPAHEKVRELLHDGAVGEIGSVHFEWLLDIRHGADYFRRWHRDHKNSGGLLVHKSSHHFDLVNWWLSARPVRVYADSRLFFYGRAAGAAHGYDRGYERATGSPTASSDPFALNLTRQPRLRELYLDTEADDGYLRDRNVFAPDVSIDDDMAVLVRYDTGATMTYHLTAYAPWEGYRLMVNGSKGRLELEVVESSYVDAPDGGPATPRQGSIASLYPGHASIESNWTRLTVHPYWEPPHTIDIPGLSQEPHGGGDARLTADLFAGNTPTADPLGRRATEIDGAIALLVGLAANASAQRCTPVDIADVIDPALLAPD